MDGGKVIVDRPANLQAVILAALGAMAWELSDVGAARDSIAAEGTMLLWPDWMDALGEGGMERWANRLKLFLDQAEQHDPGSVYL